MTDQITLKAREIIATECDKLGYKLRAQLYRNGNNDNKPEFIALIKLLKSVTPRPLDEIITEAEGKEK
jgi:hypothetical protein